MSLQRVFESARKLGLPVVVTDPSGREPFVLLPLDQFEALTGETERMPQKSPSESTDFDGKNEEKELHVAKKESSPVRETQSVPVVDSEAGLLTEERFYLGSQERES